MTDDDRVTCSKCRNLRGSLCIAAKRAGLALDKFNRCEIGPELAALPQRCPAFVPRLVAV